MEQHQTIYEKRIQNRTWFRYFLGLLSRWKMNLTYSRARRIARKRGAIIGDHSIISINLAKKANSNLEIGDHTSILSDDILLLSKVKIGSHVIIGYGNSILTTSHNIDSAEWEYKYYGIEIEDYVWIPTKVTILPSCRRIGYGSVISSGSVLVKDVEPMSVVGGNPAKEFKKRKCVHTDLVVESLLGGDYEIYKETWTKRKLK